MKRVWGLGKYLTLLFWGVVRVNRAQPLINPLHLLVNLAGSLLLLLHLQTFSYAATAVNKDANHA